MLTETVDVESPALILSAPRLSKIGKLTRINVMVRVTVASFSRRRANIEMS